MRSTTPAPVEIAIARAIAKAPADRCQPAAELAGAPVAARIAARASALAFNGTRVDVRTIGRHLNVSTLLEGTVRRVGSLARVHAQMIDVAARAASAVP